MSTLTHVASLLIHARLEQRPEVEAGILTLPGAEIAHADDQGRIIVTLETADEAEIVQTLTDIQLLSGVVNASLVFHQTDGEPEAAPASLQGATS
ncbi:chaperone NapD [Roseibium sp. M-1]